MVTLNIKTVSGEVETIKKFLVDGLDEEKKRLEYALELTQKKLKDFEKKFGMSTDMFLEKFKTGEIREDGETFEWWSEKKIVDELREKLRTITSIEICQKQKDKEMIFRFDNAEHHPEVRTYPHHKHMRDTVLPSTEMSLKDAITEAINSLMKGL